MNDLNMNACLPQVFFLLAGMAVALAAPDRPRTSYGPPRPSYGPPRRVRNIVIIVLITVPLLCL